MSQTNMLVLEELAKALNALGGPWIVGGDWNMTPSTLSTSKWPSMVGGKVVATSLHTCHNSTYDFFVVHHSLVHAIHGVQRIEDGGLNPHWPSRLLLRGDAKRHMVRKLITPEKIDAVLPHGPQKLPPAYDEVHD